MAPRMEAIQKVGVQALATPARVVMAARRLAVTMEETVPTLHKTPGAAAVATVEAVATVAE